MKQNRRSYVVKLAGSDTSPFSIDDLILPNPIHIRIVRGEQLFILPHHVMTCTMSLT